MRLYILTSCPCRLPSWEIILNVTWRLYRYSYASLPLTGVYRWRQKAPQRARKNIILGFFKLFFSTVLGIFISFKMITKKKKQASSQQGQKSSVGSTTQSKPPGRIKLKSKHKEESGARVTSSSLIPFTKYGIGYTSLVLMIGMYFIFWRHCSFLPL